MRDNACGWQQRRQRRPSISTSSLKGILRRALADRYAGWRAREGRRLNVARWVCGKQVFISALPWG